MKVDYLSLTQAINLFEKHKIKNMDVKETEEGSYRDSITIHGKAYIEKFYSFFAFIKSNIPIYGKKYPDNRYSEIELIPVSITSKLIDNETLEIFRDTKLWTLEPSPKYTIFNRYDYNDYYNHTTNYDALKELVGKTLYTDISVKQSEFNEFIDLYNQNFGKLNQYG